MNNTRTRLAAAALSAVLAGVMAPAFTASADDAAQATVLEQQVSQATVSRSLEGVVVTAHTNPFSGSDQRLALLNASLPLDTGSSAVEPTSLQRVAALFPRNPNAATGEARFMMDRTATPVSSNYDLGGR